MQVVRLSGLMFCHINIDESIMFLKGVTMRKFESLEEFNVVQ